LPASGDDWIGADVCVPPTNLRRQIPDREENSRVLLGQTISSRSVRSWVMGIDSTRAFGEAIKGAGRRRCMAIGEGTQ
jgi:hypothetical protein